MIVGADGRYALAAAGGVELVRYDRRWRRRTKLAPTNGKPFSVLEGRHHLATVAYGDDPVIEVAVRSPEDPSTPIVQARFDGREWEFEGDAQAWAWVPEYLLLPPSVTAACVGGGSGPEVEELEGEPSVDAAAEDAVVPYEGPEGGSRAERVDDAGTGRPGLLRIADEAVVDLLDADNLNAPVDVVPFPDSRLVVLVEPGRLVMYEPVVRTVLATFRLEGADRRPGVRFRAGGAELWVSDGGTLSKLDTRSWEVLAAAGSKMTPDGSGHDVAAPSDEARPTQPEGTEKLEGGAGASTQDRPAPHVPSIGAWTFNADESRCAIAIPDAGEVVIVETGAMDAVAHLSVGGALDDVAIDEGTVLAFDRAARRFGRHRFPG